MTYHEGELEMQRRAGVRALADRVGRIIAPEIPPAAAAFLAAQPFVIAATVDAGGAPTASLLAGAPGFAVATNARTVTIEPVSGHTTRVAEDVDATGVIGLLAIELMTRRRIRVNGTASRHGSTIVVSTNEVYSNCPQYIHPHRLVGVVPDVQTSGSALTPEQQQFIAAADTFFLATAHPERGADASHRGGEPGFVRVQSPSRLGWPDYPGNNMFNSLGNLAVNPRCGLLFIDFESGATLQLSGTAKVHGDDVRVVVFDVAGRLRAAQRPARQ